MLVACKKNSQCTAVAALLRDPATVMKDLRVFLRPEHVADDAGWRSFNSEKLLCDVPNIETISHSNHTLESISIDGNAPSALAKQCLWLNKCVDKAKVICNKILLFYFVGEFDVSPFSGMSASVLPEVMSQIEGSERQTALYRMLQCIPELCSVSDRNCSEQTSNTRQKIGSVHSSFN
jgi:hypothetical protein